MMELIVRTPGSSAKKRIEATAARAVKLPTCGSLSYQAQDKDGQWYDFNKKDNAHFKTMLRQDDSWTAEMVTHLCGIRLRRVLYKYTSPTIPLEAA